MHEGGDNRAKPRKEPPLSETPLRYPDPPDRDDERTTPLAPFEPALDEDEPDEHGDDEDAS